MRRMALDSLVIHSHITKLFVKNELSKNEVKGWRWTNDIFTTKSASLVRL